MSPADIAFGLFVALPVATISIAVIVATYAVPVFALYCWITARS